MHSLTVPEESFSLTPRNLGEAMEFAKIIASSDMVPKDYINKPGNVLVAVQTGAEVGLKPMQSLQGIAVINGRPAIWGDAMWALVVSHPEFEGFRDENTDAQSTVWLKRRGQGEIMRSFSMEDAKKAGLAGKQGPWTSNPKRMMQMRARAFAARDLFPDALKGIKSVEEVRDYGPEPEKDMGSADVVTTSQSNQLPTCSNEKFSENQAAWRQLIISGKKTPNDLIATLETKALLTEDQKTTIDSWAHEND
jgi:hypothetical protein